MPSGEDKVQAKTMSTPSAARPTDPSLRFARMVKRVLDDAHVDPIVGFFLPGVGDIATGLLGFSLVVIAWRRRLPSVTIARMLLNLAIDAGFGAIPLLGDLFDFYFRANSRNLALLEARIERRRGSILDGIVLVLAGMCFLAALALPFVLLVKLVTAIWTAPPHQTQTPLR